MSNQPDAAVKSRECFNCKAECQYRLLCNDCWRMLLIATAGGGTITEMVHNAIKTFIAQ